MQFTQEQLTEITNHLNTHYILIPRNSKDFSGKGTKEAHQKIVYETVLQCACKYFGLSQDEIEISRMQKVPNIKWELATIRGLIFLICREVSDNQLSYNTLGALCRDRDHATVFHSIKQYQAKSNMNKELRLDYSTIRAASMKALGLF